MADPFSIAVGVASLVAAAGKALHSIQKYRAAQKTSDISALSMKAQCDCILVALGQIQSTLLSKQALAARLVDEESVSGQSLKSVLGACELTFVVVVSRLSKIDRSLNFGKGKSSLKEKVDRLWKEGEIDELAQNISRLSDGLNLLLTAFNTKSQMEALDVLTTRRASLILEKVVGDASSIFSSDQSTSVISRLSFHDEKEDIEALDADPQGFSFDEEVRMTPAYRNVNLYAGQGPAALSAVHYATIKDGPTVKEFLIPRKPIKSSKTVYDNNAVNETMEYAQDNITMQGRSMESGSLVEPAVRIDESTVSHDQVVTLQSPLLENTTFDTYHPLELTHPIKRSNTDDSLIQSSAKTLQEAKITLKDFVPLSSSSALSDRPKPHPQKLWISATEININRQGIQFISEYAVSVVRDSLRSLFLAQNEITALPKNFGGLNALEYLNLRDNSLESFPLEICRIASLQTLHICLNEISELPLEFRSLKRLKFLNIAHNNFKDLPSFLATMPSLKVVYAHNNPYQRPWLQIWQSQYDGYGSDKAQERATVALKEGLAAASWALKTTNPTKELPFF